MPIADARPAERLALSAPLRELLVWVARCPRTYDAAMQAWCSHCPRFSVWEDALDAGLIEIQLDGRRGRDVATAPVTLTPRGRAACDAG